MEQMLQVGILSSTHGVRGEMKVFPTTDDAARFKKLKSVLLDTGSGLKEMQIEGVKFFKQFVFVKFEGINDINDVEQYRRCPLMVSREKYDEIGGLDESFAVALNDVDFCLRLREKGYLVVFTPFSLWHHYESKSRGYEDTPEKKARFEKEIKHFRERWGTVVDAGDPYYNPNFAKDREPFTLF